MEAPDKQVCPHCDHQHRLKLDTRTQPREYLLEELHELYFRGRARHLRDDIKCFKCGRCSKMLFIRADFILRRTAEEKPRQFPSGRLPRPENLAGSATTRQKTLEQFDKSMRSNEATNQETGPVTVTRKTQIDTVISAVNALLYDDRGKLKDVDDRVLLNDRYALVKPLGSGATGIVVEAYDTIKETTVAAKFHLHTATCFGSHADEPRARVVRTYKLQQMLNSPYALKAYDIIPKPDPCFVTIEEFVHGEPLAKILDDHRELMARIRAGMGQMSEVRLLSEDEAILIGVQICSVLTQARDRAKIVHRDIKPANIMRQSDGRAVLIDFGCCFSTDANHRDLRRNKKRARDEYRSNDSFTKDQAANAQKTAAIHTRTGTTLGTLNYMSPEHAAGSQVDGRTDIYALGATLYHLVCGQPPIATHDTAELIKRLTEGIPPPLASVVAANINHRISVHFSRVLNKAMATNPGERFQKPEEFSAALERCHSNFEKPQAPEERKGWFSGLFGT
jgi:serine/threonine protein kinase